MLKLLKSVQILLVILLLLSILSCKTGPIVTVCVSDPEANGFQCYNEDTQLTFTLLYQDSANYVAFSPQDAEIIIRSCLDRKKEQELKSSNSFKFVDDKINK